MDRERLNELILDYLEGLLDEEQLRELTAELQANPEARRRLLLMADMDVALSDIAKGSAISVGITQRRMRRSKAGTKRRNAWPVLRMGVAAAVLAALGLSGWLVFRPAPALNPFAQALKIVGVDGVLEWGDTPISRTDWNAISANSPLVWNRPVRAKQASAHLTLSNGEQLTLAAGTEVSVAAADPATIQIQQGGEIYCEIPKSTQTPTPGQPKRVRFAVRTPVAEAQVYGTKFGVKRSGDQLEVSVMEGQVACSNAQGRTEIAAGEICLTVMGRAPGQPNFGDVRARLAWALPAGEQPATSSVWESVACIGLPELDRNGGGARALVFDREGSLFAAYSRHGVYRSQDRGAHWAAFNKGIDVPIIYALGLNSQGELLAGSSGDKDGPNGDSKCFVLPNGSETWKAAGIAGADRLDQIQSFWLDAHERVLLVTASSLLRSSDGGRNYAQLNDGLSKLGLLHVLTQDSKTGIVLAGTSVGCFFSADDGNRWQSRLSSPTNTLALDRHGELLMGISAGRNNHLLLRRGNDGKFQDSDAGLPNGKPVINLTSTPEGFLFALVPGNGAFASLDDGHTWQALNHGLPSLDIQCMTPDGKGALFAGMTSGRVYRINITAAVHELPGK